MDIYRVNICKDNPRLARVPTALYSGTWTSNASYIIDGDPSLLLVVSMGIYRVSASTVAFVYYSANLEG